MDTYTGGIQVSFGCRVIVRNYQTRITRHFLGCKIFLARLQHFFTDNNPLVPILNSHHLDEIENYRLQRLKFCLMAYNFTIQ